MPNYSLRMLCVAGRAASVWRLRIASAVARYACSVDGLYTSQLTALPVQYYEAVGPLPARPQGPLWRSPSRSPGKHRPECQHHQGSHDQDEHRDEEVQAHRQAISRHRQQWARAKTPPGYWEIGFPSTQEVTDMNARAREMHRDKLRAVEAEARKDGGRYRRR